MCSTTTIHKHSSTHGETWRGPAARYKRGKLMVMFRGWPRADVGTNTSILKASFSDSDILFIQHIVFLEKSSTKDRRENDGQIELESKGSIGKGL